jgi:hypothetical protein
MEMLEYVYEQTTGLRWQDEDEAIQFVWRTAWNASLKAINQQVKYLYYNHGDEA